MDRAGKLYVVATPIGNLGDMTFRAVDVLKGVNLILAEDTRETRKLLDKYQIDKELLSYRDQNHLKMFPLVHQRITLGEDIALVSDAGTPLISDPGYKLVTELIHNGVEIIAVPGPSALIAALSVSGLPTDRFAFLGFLPKSKSKRRSIMESSLDEEQTVLIYESPYRIHSLLEIIEQIDATRSVVIANDLTKMHEVCWRGNVKDIRSKIPSEKSLKGEFVVMVGKKGFNLS